MYDFIEDIDFCIDTLYARKNYIIADGNCGDHLFGASITTNRYKDKYHMPWQDFLRIYANETLSDKNLKANQINAFINQIEEWMQVSTLPIKEFCEMAWFMLFALKWEECAHKLKMETKAKYIRDSIYPFYATEDFQSWSVGRFTDISKYPDIEPLNYKRELKKIIFDFTNDSSYLHHKGKTVSGYKFKKHFIGLYDSEVGYIVTDKLTNEEFVNHFYRKYFK